MYRFSLIPLIFVVLFAFIGGAQAAPCWSDAESISSGYYESQLRITADGRQGVALDCSNQSYDSSSNYECEIIYFYEDNGTWEKQVVANNGIKQDFPFFRTIPVISGDGTTLVYMGFDSDGNDFRLYIAQKQPNGLFDTPEIIQNVPSGWFNPGIDLNYTGDLLVYVCGDGEGFFGGTATLYYIENIKDRWSNPKKIYDPTSGEYAGAAIEPSLDKYGNSVAWIQNSHQGDVFYSKRTTSGFGEPTILTSSEENEARLIMSGDGKTIAFWRVYEEYSTYTGQDLFITKKTGDGWSQPQKVTAAPLDVSGFYDGRPALNYDGTRLIYNNYYSVWDPIFEYSTIMYGRLVMSEYQNDSWNTPTEITATTWGFDNEPNLSEDGKILIFSDAYGIGVKYSSQMPPPGEEPDVPGEPTEPDEHNGQYDLWNERFEVTPNKEWKIQFNQEVNTQTTHEDSVFVKDTRLNIIPTDLRLDDKNRTVYIKPKENYNSGQRYFLYITRDVQNPHGKNLARPIKMPFTIK